MNEPVDARRLSGAPAPAPWGDRPRLALATRTRRLGAALLDLFVLVAVMSAASLLTRWEPFADPATRDRVQLATDTLATFGLFVLVNGFTLARGGQTIGKLMLGLRMVRPDGAPASLARLVGLRYGFLLAINLLPGVGALLGLIDVLLIARRSRRCLHDDLADTVVVDAP